MTTRHHRVLVVAPAPLGDERIGGIVNFIREFVKNLPDDLSVEIVGPAVREDAATGWQTIELAGRQVRFRPVVFVDSARRTGRIPIKARIVAGMLRSAGSIHLAGRVTQVHAPGMDLGLISRRAPIVRVVHNDPRDLASHAGESTWRRLGSSLSIVERLSFRRAAALYFVNRATFDEAGSTGGGDKMHFLPNFVDTALFRPLTGARRAERRAEIAHELRIPDDAPWLLFAGRLDHQKNPVRALEALAATGEGAAAPHLVIAGTGVLESDARQAAQRLDVAERSHFLGGVGHDDLARMMPAMDAFVLTSDFEAGPTVVYEALAAGLPVVSTRVGEVPRLVTHEATGYLSDGSAIDLASGIAWATGQAHDALAESCAGAVAHLSAAQVLEPFYEMHRLLSPSR